MSVSFILTPVFSAYIQLACMSEGSMEGYGSGVFISPSEILTVAHNRCKEGQLMAQRRGLYYETENVSVNEELDLLLLRVRGLLELHPAKLHGGHQGMRVCVFGSGMLVDGFLSCGVISAVGEHKIAVDAVPFFGMSGAAVFDGKKRLVGLGQAFRTDGAGHIVIAIRSDVLHLFVEKARKSHD